VVRGRFAPSPTGPLHFGSLVAAVGSYLHARSHDGEWLVRIEDLDPPREVAGAAADQLTTLERFGFEWDGAVLYQSTRGEAYAEALQFLIDRDLAYPCGCSRREIEGDVYPGTCRHGLPPGKEARAWRVRTDHDDFIIKRGDGYWAYQIACAVDDAFQAITHVVRGADLADSMPRQVHLLRLLEKPIPEYIHLPVVMGPDGKKLSKTLGSKTLGSDPSVRSAVLCDALSFLGHPPPPALRAADLDAVWSWAHAAWHTTWALGSDPNPVWGQTP